MLALWRSDVKVDMLVDEVLYLRQHHLPPPTADEMMEMRRDGSLTQLNITQTLRMEMHLTD